MTGLVPVIHVAQPLYAIPSETKRPTVGAHKMPGGWVYIMTNRPNGILYTGVTSDLAGRAWEHREGLVKGFTQRYGLERLVYTEVFEDIRDAIQREKSMKHYSRAWKVGLILETNRDWRDLYEGLNKRTDRSSRVSKNG